MKFFKPEDFVYQWGPDYQVSVKMTDIANSKLEREGVKVKGVFHKGYIVRAFGEVCNDSFLDSHEALLINIKPIARCAHEFDWICIKRNGSITYYECICGAEVIPTSFKEKK